jgi:hypothetical protein
LELSANLGQHSLKKCHEDSWTSQSPGWPFKNTLIPRSYPELSTENSLGNIDTEWERKQNWISESVSDQWVMGVGLIWLDYRPKIPKQNLLDYQYTLFLNWRAGWKNKSFPRMGISGRGEHKERGNESE